MQLVINICGFDVSIFSRLHAWIVALLAICLLSTLPPAVNASIAQTVEPGDALLEKSFHTILVVKTKNLNPGPYTNANPPTGQFDVEEVLRGQLDADVVELFWRPKKTLAEFEPWAKSMPEDWRIHFYRRPLREGWHQKQMLAPEIGERLIVFGLLQRPKASPVPSFKVVRAIRYSPANRKVVVDHMAEPDRHPRIQGKVFLCILGVSLLTFIFACLTPLVFPKSKKVLGIMLTMLVAACSFPLYVFYEIGIKTGGIRIDVLILYPALFVDLIVIVICAIRLIRARPIGGRWRVR